MTTETEADCLFCKIVAGLQPADVVADTERVLAFRDIDPQAPVHVLVVPKEHHGDVSVLAAADPELLAEVVAVADEIAHDLADGQYRFIFNSGPRAGQSVFHVHGHVLAGTQLGWSPA
ncbi:MULTISPECIES: histidine triad nucleotide-binding protein [Isoptericola]|uniref:Histidine triad nucleotide-binding protein n=1 Tax=Isoptericola sediminis TaxID=2733572 RepID=A0A849KAZ1_9MICO|nr:MULTISPECIES: histidine triad nucleotide-binding protein [Isoptericola]MDO8145344.1 histidine triad nucleotide-binding protein [Isoptericola sp. 178]MDO8148985.1 histidine triad nucleotide-binding protein [Isoptericola sp. b515]MDO8151075.1 histidine triad nucleotide-binding protein [Isoptericola sp. b408]NNU28407.1 histidine triad nucleotide-binding protein [Isoptericola sediminis]